jgi:hypothetical protein
MSENLDLVRSTYADWERGDSTRGDWPEEYRELDAERVLVIGYHGGRGKTSGVESGRCRRR